MASKSTIYRRRRLFQALLQVRSNPEDKSCGICGNVKDILGYSNRYERVTESLFRCWPKFSGNIYYPVPSGAVDPEIKYAITHNMWSGKYGKLRLELLDHMIVTVGYEIKRLEEELSNEQASN